MPVVSKGFKDISLSFLKHPITNDILVLKNEDAIKKSVVNLVKTRIGERFFNSLLGSKANEALFEVSNSGIDIALENEIRNLLINFEKRIRVKNIDVEIVEDDYELNVKVIYDIVGITSPQQTLEFILQPTRV
jgi:phage baseplate assembly protein W